MIEDNFVSKKSEILNGYNSEKNRLSEYTKCVDYTSYIINKIGLNLVLTAGTHTIGSVFTV